MADQPNIILIVVDSMRADHMSCYGYERETTPRIDELVNENGVKIDHCYTDSHWSLPAHTSLFSGATPSEHDITDREQRFEQHNKLLDLLDERGYTTLGVSNNPFVSNVYGLDTGFDRFQVNLGAADLGEDARKILKDLKERDWDSQQQNYLATLKRAGLRPRTILELLHYKLQRSWLYGLSDSGGKMSLQTISDLTDDEPFFAFTNIMEVHGDYLPPLQAGRAFAGNRIRPKDGLTGPGDDQSRLDERTDYYDESIRYVDSIIGDFIEAMRDQHPNTVFIITADHGELFYDNDPAHEDEMDGHGASTDEGFLHIPLLIIGDVDIQDTDQAMALSNLTGLISAIADDASYQPPGYAITENLTSEPYARRITDGKNTVTELEDRIIEDGDPDVTTQLRERLQQHGTSLQEFLDQDNGVLKDIDI